jgi:hypothetical protein
MLTSRWAQIGGGAAAFVVLALLGYWLWPSGPDVPEMCKPIMALAKDDELRVKLEARTDAIAADIKSPQFEASVEAKSKPIFNELPASQQAQANVVLQYLTCVQITKDPALQPNQAMILLLKSRAAIDRSAQSAQEGRIRKVQDCIDAKRNEYAARQSFQVQGSARAPGPGVRAGVVKDTRAVCYSAAQGYGISSAQVRQTSCNDNRCSYSAPRYQTDASGNAQVCVDIEARSEAQLFGAGGWIGVDLYGEIGKTITSKIETDIANFCTKPAVPG